VPRPSHAGGRHKPEQPAEPAQSTSTDHAHSAPGMPTEPAEMDISTTKGRPSPARRLSTMWRRLNRA
jgi:hypothetical protein